MHTDILVVFYKDIEKLKKYGKDRIESDYNITQEVIVHFNIDNDLVSQTHFCIIASQAKCFVLVVSLSTLISNSSCIVQSGFK